eukprot:6491808-Prymnesium_polylepis.1
MSTLPGAARLPGPDESQEELIEGFTNAVRAKWTPNRGNFQHSFMIDYPRMAVFGELARVTEPLG